MKKQYEQKPTIKCGDTTKKQLDQLKLVQCETYESVIIRLIEEFRRSKK